MDRTPIRAFVAILIDPTTRSALHSQIDALQAAAPRITWVAPENVHLTLKFLGSVERAAVEPVIGRLGQAVSTEPAFALPVAGLGAFPSVMRARVVWAGVAGSHDRVIGLAARVEASLEAVGFPRETRPFSPHLTLGRARTPGRDDRLAALISAGVGRGFGTVQVASVSLMQSVLTPRGARYSELARIALGTS